MWLISALSIFLFLDLPSASPTSNSLRWTKCSSANLIGLSCTKLEVPVNWDDPKSSKTNISMARFEARKPKDRIGALIFNPGGPGVSTIDMFLALAINNVSLFGSEVRDRFDIIGPDLRGVGHSHTIKCDPKLWNKRVTSQPKTEEELNQLVQINKEIGKSCRKLTGPLLGFMDTKSCAKDVEAIRVAMDEEKISFLGVSYGTLLGQTYAQIFPRRIRTMALDSCVDHSLSETSALTSEVYSYENEFNRFANWCERTHDCPLYGHDIPYLFQDMVKKADRSPIPAPGCKKSGLCREDVTGEELRFNLHPMLMYKYSIPDLGFEGWNYTATALKQAHEGDATKMSTLLAKTPGDAVISGNGIGVLCLDFNHTDVNTLPEFKYKNQVSHHISPNTLGASTAFRIFGRCVGWPEQTRYHPSLSSIIDAPPILLTNAFHDPATSYVWASGLRDQIKNSVLASRRGDGHTSYFLRGETAAAIDSYLLSGKTPPDNIVYDS